jgi:hypothetical protein
MSVDPDAEARIAEGHRKHRANARSRAGPALYRGYTAFLVCERRVPAAWGRDTLCRVVQIVRRLTRTHRPST